MSVIPEPPLYPLFDKDMGIKDMGINGNAL